MRLPKVIKQAGKEFFHVLGLEISQHDLLEATRYLWLKQQNIHTVLDIGANVGNFSAMIRQVLPDAMLYAFEPLPDCYAKLIARMRRVPNFQAFNFALGREDSEMEMYRSEFSSSSSLLKMADLHKQAFPFTQALTREKITVKRLDSIAPGLKLADNLLIKIDVQGYEDQVILGGQSVISRARVLIVETSFQQLYEQQPLFGTIFDLLRQMHFEYHGNLSQLTNPNDGSVLQADSVFIKTVDADALPQFK